MADELAHGNDPKKQKMKETLMSMSLMMVVRSRVHENKEDYGDIQ